MRECVIENEKPAQNRPKPPHFLPFPHIFGLKTGKTNFFSSQVLDFSDMICKG
jgi:hypothetical protein